MNYFVLLIIILLEGFVTISIEILAIRQLIPSVGNSVIVTSLIIGIFLLFLAYGYRRGGEYTSGFREKLKTNFMIAGIFTGFGLSYTFVTFFFTAAQYFFQFHVLLTLTLYLLAIIAPIIYFLGQTVPITVNLFKEENAKTIGAISGKVLHLSTLGSFLGAVLTTLFFMNYLGVAWTIIVNVGILLFLIILLTDDIKRELWKLLGIVGVFIIVTEFNLSTERINFLKTTPYGNYQVNSTDTGKVLMINDSSSSYISNTEQGFPYIEYIKQVLFDDLKLHNKKILVLGAGGFTLSAERHDENRFTYVDIDPDIKSIVEHHFLMSNKIKGEFYAEDARTYVKNTMEYYDVIVSDVYSNTMTIPAHLLTQEHLQAIQARLAPDGIAVFNIIARPLLTDAYSKRMDNTVRSVFQRCMATPLKYSPEITNIIYLCRNSKEKEEDDRQIYTDNKNSSTMDFFNLR